MRKLLVTGGAGFVGVNFVYHWLAGHPCDLVVVLDALTYAGNRASLARAEVSANYRFIHGDICDHGMVAELLRHHQIDTIVNFAAESHVDRSILGPDAFVETNMVGTHALLKAARQVWQMERTGAPGTCRFHHVSTDEVYGSLGPVDPPCREAAPYAPNSPYAASKAAADHLVRAYGQTYGLPVTTSNCSNNYGPYQFPEKLVPLSLINILTGKAIPLYGDGLNIRDWLYVADHCRGIELVLEKGRPGEVYNLGGDNEQTNIAIIQALCAGVDACFAAEPALRERFPQSPAAQGRNSSDLLSYVKDRPGHDRRYAIDAHKSAVALGFAPAESFASGLSKTIAWYLENEPWWRSIMDGSYKGWLQEQYGV